MGTWWEHDVESVVPQKYPPFVMGVVAQAKNGDA